MSSERKVPDDHELEDFLAGRHPVGRAYREVSEHQTAPRELDAAILRMACEEASTVRDTKSVRRRPRWIKPLAVAATLALSLGVLMNIWREPALRKQAVPMEEGEEQAESAGATSSSSAQPEIAEPIEAARPLRDGSAAARAPAEQKRRDALGAAESRGAEPFPGQGPGLAERPREDRPGSTVSPSAVSPRAEAAMPPPPPRAPAPSSPLSAPAAQAGGAALSRPAIDPRVLDSDGPGADRRSESYEFGSSEESDAAASGTPASATERGEPSDARAKQEPAVEKSMATDAAAPVEAPSADPETRDVLIERARAAVARGETAQARRLVAELRRLYPDSPMPEDLRSLAQPAP